MRTVIRLIPNTITLLNLVFGVLAIIMSFDIDYLAIAPLFIFAAALCDFLDGWAARLFNAYSELGKQLDSLSDMVSFGVAPAILMFQLIKMILINDNDMFTYQNMSFSEAALLSVPFLIVICSALRLAKFNTDESQHYSFKGLPTPASALFFSSLTYILLDTNYQAIVNILLNVNIIIPLIIIISLLMVSPFRMMALKFKDYAIKNNYVRYSFLLAAVILFVFFSFMAIPVIILLYILLSIILTKNL